MDSNSNNTTFYNRDQEQIERKVSMATTITIASRPAIVPKKSVTSTISSDSRRPSTTPLSIAERFMSSNYKPQQDTSTIITKVLDESFFTQSTPPPPPPPLLLTSIISTDTPINQHTDEPAAAPVFSLSFDSEPQEDITRLTNEGFTAHPLDDTHTKTRGGSRKTKCNSGCSEMHNNKRSDLHKKKRHQQQQQQQQQHRHHQHYYYYHHKHNRNNRIDIIKAIAIDDPTVPETAQASEKSKVGVWVGSCCFIQWAGSSKKQDPLLPIKHRRSEDADRRRRCCCWGRRAWVMLAFLAVLMVAVLVFFFWPRIPLIRIEGAINTIPTKVTQTQQGGQTSNVAFESTWLLNITMDNRRNFFTTRFNRIQIIAKDAMTGLLIGKGLNNNVEAGIVVYLPGKEISTIQLPISVNYQARDSTDATFSNLMRACHHTNTTTTTMMMAAAASSSSSSGGGGGHHSLSIHFWFTLYLFGLDWLGYRPTLIATPATGGFSCPSVLY